MKKKITILGSTGSIGSTTLRVINYKKNLFDVDTLIANSNYKKISQQILKFKPRNFNAGVFKFRLTPSGSLPQDGDLYRTVTRGIRGSSMPSWHMLPDKVRIAVIQYIKYELAVDRSDPEEPYHYFLEEPAEAPMYIGMAERVMVELLEESLDEMTLAN